MKYASLTLLVLAAACNGGGGPIEGDIPIPEGLNGAEPTGDVALIQQIDWSCTPEQWVYTAETDGLAATLRLQIIDTSAWDGSSELPPRDPEEGVWRESTTFFLTGEDPWLWEKTLTYNDVPSQVANSTSETLFLCGRDNPDNLAYSFQVLDAEEKVFDCALWGHLSEAWFVDNWGLNECLCFEPEEDGACGDHSTVGGTDSGM